MYSIRPPVKRLIRRWREYCQSNGTDTHRRRNCCSKTRKNVKKSNNMPIQKQFCCTYTCSRESNASSTNDSMEFLAQKIRTISLQATNDYGSQEWSWNTKTSIRLRLLEGIRIWCSVFKTDSFFRMSSSFRCLDQWRILGFWTPSIVFETFHNSPPISV